MEYPRHMVYETYDEMDLILAKLHTPTFESDETLSLGPFGVFEGIKQIKETRSQKSKSSNKRRKAEKGKSEETVVLAKEQGFSWNAANNLNNDINVQFQEIMATLSTPIPGAFTSSEPMFEEILSTMFSDVTNPLSEEVDYQSIQDNLSALLATDGINFNFGESPPPLPAQPHVQPRVQPRAQVQSPPPPSSPPPAAAATPSLPPPRLTHDEPGTRIVPERTRSPSFENEVHLPNPATSNINFAQEVANFGPDWKSIKVIPQTEYPYSSLLAVLEDPLNRHLSTDNKFGIPTSTVYFTPQARFLLDYYIHNVIPIMTVIAHPKNPWKTIYLPRAFTAIAELTSLGHTAAARNALLHALLSVSAFNLQSKFEEGSEQKRHFLNIGVQLKSEAYKWLTDCLKKDLALQKYKDAITAILSMVTIDVMSGSMTDCSVHLRACRRIVDIRYKTRRRISKKALILHRIAGFLSLMQRSTELDPKSLNSSDQNAEKDEWLSQMLDDDGDLNPTQNNENNNSEGTGSNPLMSMVYMMNPLNSRLLDKKNGKCHKLPESAVKELITTQTLYGIPDSLVFLFNDTVKLTRKARRYKLETKNVSHNKDEEIYPKEFSSLCSIWELLF